LDWGVQNEKHLATLRRDLEAKTGKSITPIDHILSHEPGEKGLARWLPSPLLSGIMAGLDPAISFSGGARGAQIAPLLAVVRA
jgi:hypothetical protein